MAVNRFLLLSLNVVILLLLGTYLMNLFNVKTYETMTFVYLFVGAMAVVLISNEFIEKFGLSNPVYFILPGIIAIAAPFVMGKAIPASIVLGGLMLAPGIILLSRNLFKKKD